VVGTKYTDEEKRKLIDKFEKDRELKSQGKRINLNAKYGVSMVQLISQWVRIERFGRRTNKKYQLRCLCCGSQFESVNKEKKFCSEECMEQGRQQPMTKKPSICFDCVNYYVCGKMDKPLKVQDRMIDHELVDYARFNNRWYTGQCLKVYKCKGFVSKHSLSEEQMKIKYKALMDNKKVFFTKGLRTDD
jgi:hypothetical protein